MPIFDVKWERVEEILVWVHLLALPPHLWTMEIFRAIGNSMCIFLDVDMSFQVTKSHNVAHLLVCLVPREDLIEKIHLHLDGKSFFQIIDYEHLPFRCHRCHKYGDHLVRDFPLGISRRRRQRVIYMNDYRAQVTNQSECGEQVQMEEVVHQQE